MKKVRKNGKLHFKDNILQENKYIKNKKSGEASASERLKKSFDKTRPVGIKNKKSSIGKRKSYVQKSSEDKGKKIETKRENKELILNLILSFIVLIAIESFSRRDFLQSFDFIREYPIQAIVNYVLIFILFSISMFFRRKKFVRFIIGFILILLSFISGLVMNFRGMPLFPYDIMSFKEAIKISSIFLSMRFEIIVAAVIVVFIVISLIIFKKEGKRKRFISKRNLFVLIVTIGIYIVAIPQLNKARIISPMAWNPGASFEKNGFTYSFLRESVLAIRRKPKGYSEEKIKEIRAKVDKAEKNDKRKILKGKNRPNIIFIQLEAFMDPTRIKGAKFNEDPMPNMRRLMKNYTSGLMNVPVTGGGTARTEYEVLSGSNFQYLNQGEIPYQTFLSEKPSISLATTMNKDGYKSVAIHNFYQRFYNRNKGLENLGFDKFVPLDVMTNVEYTPMYWPKDKILTRYIEEQIDSRNTMVKDNAEDTKGNKPAFIFTISTQGHSRYPFTKLKIDYPIELVNSNLLPPDQNQLSYYTNQIKEMDDFVGKLIEDINKSKEPTVLVLYGDHLPALDIITRNQAGVDKFESMFVVVNNIGKKKVEIPKDFQAYQLSTLALETAKQPYGPMNLIHAYLKNDKDYQKDLELVQYDILFGKKYFLKKDEMPFKKKMEVNSEDLKIKKVEQRNGEFFILGEGFNRNTEVYINGKKVESDYYDDKTLRLYDNYYSGEKEIVLKLVDNNGNTIQQTKKIRFKF